MAIVGASGSGKTTLYYQLMTGEYRETVSSIDENYTGPSGLSVCRLKKDQETVEKKIECIDIPGHYNFRERVQDVASSDVTGVILTVDSMIGLSCQSLLRFFTTSSTISIFLIERLQFSSLVTNKTFSLLEEQLKFKMSSRKKSNS